MRVFETATTELRLMHDASDLMNLEKVSRNYYCIVSPLSRQKFIIRNEPDIPISVMHHRPSLSRQFVIGGMLYAS